MKTKLYKLIAQAVAARINCLTNDQTDVVKNWEQTLENYEQHLPSGSGFDAGTQLDLARSTPDKLVLTTDYHHMNEVGYYDGWTSHTVIVTPSLQFDFTLAITGKNKNDIKEYIADTFNLILSSEIE